VSQGGRLSGVGTTAKCRIRGAGIFAGDLYFDLALYIQQLTVPTVMLWGEQAQLPASIWDGWAVEPAGNSSN